MEKQLEQLPELEPDRVDLMNRPPLDGIEKFLWWHREANILTLQVIDHKQLDEFEVQVPNDKGLEAFKHPFLYEPNPGD